MRPARPPVALRRRPTRGATGTVSTGPPSFPADSRSVVGAVNLSLALNAPPAVRETTGCQAEPTRCATTASRVPRAAAVIVTVEPCTTGPPGRVSESVENDVIHV